MMIVKKVGVRIFNYVMAVAEYFYFGSLAMGIIFTSFVAWELLKSFCLLSILIFIVVTGKVTEKDSRIYKLLFTHMTMRNLLQKQNANIYFFKFNFKKMPFF